MNNTINRSTALTQVTANVIRNHYPNHNICSIINYTVNYYVYDTSSVYKYHVNKIAKQLALSFSVTLYDRSIGCAIFHASVQYTLINAIQGF